MLTSRLLLRPLHPTDAPVIAAYRSDPDVARYQSWTAPFTNEDADMLINELVEADPAKPGWTQYGIELRSVGRLIGDLGVNLHRNRMQAEIGFTVAASHQGHGYGPEAVSAMLDHLITEVGAAQGLGRVRRKKPGLGQVAAEGRIPSGGTSAIKYLRQGRVDRRSVVRPAGR